ncbi:transposase [Streptomyces sp. V3I8]|uniref:transposase n=1 Tax=Streptomyces sp. V3I8 TaxID=3042279 RepID=UPI003593CBC8
MPAAAGLDHGARWRTEKHPRRTIFDAIRYVCSEDCWWRSPPVDFPPSPTVYGFLRRWTKSGVWDGGKLIHGRKRHLLTETHGLPRT